MTGTDREPPPDPVPGGAAPGDPGEGAEVVKDNRYGRSSAEATRLTQDARTEARTSWALRRRDKPKG
ncbi:MAG: hypothetical protein JNK88_09320 [Mangrovicoccus sp.]|nr:hypothetical protein [Mangrovicoccus sp.]